MGEGIGTCRRLQFVRILFCGDRYWTDKKVILAVMRKLRPSVVIEGEAKGADSLARESAKELGIEVFPFPADWSTYGRAAGPIRNKLMLDEGHPELVVAFHDNLPASKGTRDMVSRARIRGIKTVLVEHDVRSLTGYQFVREF
jgi:peptidoglycan/xylan/chitin deacetylase (PgdA/CDA1 family)